MELINEQVKHRTLGSGQITSFDGKYVTIQFPNKTSKFTYPSAFEVFLRLDNENKQSAILAAITREKQAEDDKKRSEEMVRKKAKETRNAAFSCKIPSAGRPRAKSMDEMFSEDYHAAHLARQPVLFYQQVEEQFGIQISGFGRGINPTPSTVVLISSIGKAGGKFVYHDKWTSDGDYIYSGEGKAGNQSMTKGNYAIKNAALDSKKIHLFVKLSPQEYYYQGVFDLVDIAYEEEKDENGNTRKEYKFRLRKVR